MEYLFLHNLLHTILWLLLLCTTYSEKMQTYNLDIDKLIPHPPRQLHFVPSSFNRTRICSVEKESDKRYPDKIRYCAEQFGIQQQNYEHSGIQPQNQVVSKIMDILLVFTYKFTNDLVFSSKATDNLVFSSKITSNLVFSSKATSILVFSGKTTSNLVFSSKTASNLLYIQQQSHVQSGIQQQNHVQFWYSAAKPRPIWYSEAKPQPIGHSAPDLNTTDTLFLHLERFGCIYFRFVQLKWAHVMGAGLAWSQVGVFRDHLMISCLYQT